MAVLNFGEKVLDFKVGIRLKSL